MGKGLLGFVLMVLGGYLDPWGLSCRGAGGLGASVAGPCRVQLKVCL